MTKMRLRDGEICKEKLYLNFITQHFTYVSISYDNSSGRQIILMLKLNNQLQKFSDSFDVTQPIGELFGIGVHSSICLSAQWTFCLFIYFYFLKVLFIYS